MTGMRRRGGDDDGDGGQPVSSEPLEERATPSADTFLLGLGAPQECLRVANVNDDAARRPLPGFEDVYVGRTTTYGNPFPMGDRGQDERLRDRVCNAFQALIEAPPSTRAVDVAGPRRLQVDARFRGAEARDWGRAMHGLAERLRAGKRLRLLCHCLPKRCHAQSIGQWLMRHIQTGAGGASSDGDGGNTAACLETLDAVPATPGGSGVKGGSSSGGDGGGDAVGLETPDAASATPGGIGSAGGGGNGGGGGDDAARLATPDTAWAGLGDSGSMCGSSS